MRQRLQDQKRKENTHRAHRFNILAGDACTGAYVLLSLYGRMCAPSPECRRCCCCTLLVQWRVEFRESDHCSLKASIWLNCYIFSRLNAASLWSEFARPRACKYDCSQPWNIKNRVLQRSEWILSFAFSLMHALDSDHLDKPCRIYSNVSKWPKKVNPAVKHWERRD